MALTVNYLTSSLVKELESVGIFLDVQMYVLRVKFEFN